jgi:hypothetical protein
MKARAKTLENHLQKLWKKKVPSKKKSKWIAGIIVSNSVWDGNVGRPTRGDEERFATSSDHPYFRVPYYIPTDVFSQSTKS